MDISTSSQIHKNKDMWVFRKVKLLIYESPVNLDIPTELLAFPVLRILDKNGTADPKYDLLPYFQIIFMVDGPWLIALGSMLMADGQESRAALPQIFSWPWDFSHKYCAISDEPWEPRIYTQPMFWGGRPRGPPDPPIYVGELPPPHTPPYFKSASDLPIN